MFSKQSILTGCLAIVGSLILNWIYPLEFYLRIIAFIGVYFLAHIIVSRFLSNKDNP